MNVFLSWSGNRSKHVADAMYEWLPLVLQPVRPFLSSEIEKGKRGLDKIANSLDTANVGIVCLNQANQSAPWILFEAGALSKQATSLVCTLLFEMEPTDVSPPLSQFQHTTCTKEDIRKLLGSLNNAMSESSRLSPSSLDRTFELWWPILDTKLSAIPKQEGLDDQKQKSRSTDDMIRELLLLVRQRNDTLPTIAELSSPISIAKLRNLLNMSSDKAASIASRKAAFASIGDLTRDRPSLYTDFWPEVQASLEELRRDGVLP
jgi:hypothetical protein